MGDLYVHARMKECCRSTLKDLDKRKRSVKARNGLMAVRSLHKALADKPVDDAKVTLGALAGGEFESIPATEHHTVLIAEACGKVCASHAAMHESAGEAEEAELWHALAHRFSRRISANLLKSITRKPPGTYGTLNGKHYVVYANEVRAGGHRNWRNNNPGNLEYVDFSKRHGAIGGDGRFAIFPDEATGAAALKRLLQGPTYKDRDIVECMKNFAPPTENDTALYTSKLETITGLSRKRTMGSLSDDEMDAFTAAMKKLEGWQTGVGDTYTAGSSADAAPFKKLLGVQ